MSTGLLLLGVHKPLAAAGGDPVSLDAENGGRSSGAGTQVSATLTVGSNSNRVLVALIYQDQEELDTEVSGVAYTAGSGGAWTRFNGSASPSNGAMEIWYSIAPAAGSTTVQVTLAGSVSGDRYVEIYSLYNVDQTTPLDGYGSNVTSESGLAVSSNADDMALVMLGGGSNPGAIVNGTEDMSDVFNSYFKAGHIAGASPTATVSWTNAVGAIVAGCNVRAV